MNAPSNKAVSSIKIGTRASPLAQAQAREVADRLSLLYPDLETELVVLNTKGDRITDRPLIEIGGKGLFTQEIEDSLITGEIDIAVHSMKDVATVLPEGLIIDTILKREDCRDVFLSFKASSLDTLPAGSVVGTASLRRQAQVLSMRPDLKVVVLRGNVQTRLKKLKRGDVDATLLALAGLKRLHLADLATSILSEDLMLPAAAQGAIGIETRVGNTAIQNLIAPLNDPQTNTCLTAERAFLATLDGSCRTPIAALARINDDGNLYIKGALYAPDGTRSYSIAMTGRPEEAQKIGTDAGNSVRKKAGDDFKNLIFAL